MSKDRYYCAKHVLNAISENDLDEAFYHLADYIELSGLSRYLGSLVSIKSRFKRADKAFKSGLISWDDYDIASSRVIAATIDFTHELCNFLIEFKRFEFQGKRFKQKPPPPLFQRNLPKPGTDDYNEYMQELAIDKLYHDSRLDKLGSSFHRLVNEIETLKPKDPGGE